jgi:DNA-binding NtrC family response regulator
VRELRNAVERAITLAAPDEPVAARHLAPASPGLSPTPLPQWSTLRERVERVEAEAIREALERCGGNRRRMAEALGLSRPGLRYKMRRLGLDDGDGK